MPMVVGSSLLSVPSSSDSEQLVLSLDGSRNLTIASPSGTIVFQGTTSGITVNSLTNPTIAGAALSGNFSGTPTFTGAVGFSSTISAAQITSTGTSFVQAGNVTGTNNVLRMQPTASGTDPSISIIGPDTNRNIKLIPAGAGQVNMPRILNGAAITMSGTFDATQSPFWSSSSVTGTATETGFRDVFRFDIPSDNVAAAGSLVGASFNVNYGGAALTGGRIAHNVGLTQTAATNNSTGNTFYQAGNYQTQCLFQEPGSTAPTLSGSKGQPFGLGVYCILGPNALNYTSAAGMEIDVAAGAQPYKLFGMSVVRLTNGYGTLYQASEPSLDIAYKIGNGVPGGQWINGFTVTDTGANWAMDPIQGNILIAYPGHDYATSPPKAKRGVDFTYVQFADAAWRSQGAKIDPVGAATFSQLSVGNWALSLSTGGLSIGPSVAQIALSIAVASGGTGYSLNEQFSFATNGRGIVTGLSSGVVTSVSILEAPTAATLPGNPVATTSLQFSGAGQSSGSGLTLNLTASTPTTLTLNPGGGGTTVGGALTIPTPAGGDNSTSAATTAYVQGQSRRLFVSGVSQGNGADLTADTLMSFTIPSGLFTNVGDTLTIRASGTWAASTDSKQVLVKLGSTTIANPTATAAAQTKWTLDCVVVCTGANAQSVMTTVTMNGNVTTGTTTLTTTVNNSGTVAFALQGQNSTNSVANSVTCQVCVVDYTRAS